MKKSNPSINKSMFLQSMKSGEPTTFKNIEPGKLGIGFYNSLRGSTFSNGASQVDFKIDQAENLSIADLKTKTTGVYTVTVAIKWLSAAKETQRFSEASPSKNTAQPFRKVREAIIAYNTGHIQISFWEEHFESIEENKFFQFSDVSVKYFNGYKLSTRRETCVTELETSDKLDWSTVDIDDYVQRENDAINATSPVICCPQSMAAMVDTRPVCTNGNCSGNIEFEAGSKLVHCLSCKKRMLLKNCPKLFQCVIDITKDGITKSITASEAVVAKLFKEDQLLSKYHSAPQSLKDKVLMLENIDFHLISKNAITHMEARA
eukprot:gene1052-380_t